MEYKYYSAKFMYAFYMHQQAGALERQSIKPGTSETRDEVVAIENTSPRTLPESTTRASPCSPQDGVSKKGNGELRRHRPSRGAGLSPTEQRGREGDTSTKPSRRNTAQTASSSLWPIAAKGFPQDQYV